MKGVTQLITSRVGAALANAIYDAVGIRLTDLPITLEKLPEVMERASNAKPR